jgi:hypothetical protein
MAKRLKQPEIIWDDLIDTPVAQKLKKTATGKSADGLQGRRVSWAAPEQGAFSIADAAAWATKRA